MVLSGFFGQLYTVGKDGCLSKRKDWQEKMKMRRQRGLLEPQPKRGKHKSKRKRNH